MAAIAAATTVHNFLAESSLTVNLMNTESRKTTQNTNITTCFLLSYARVLFKESQPDHPYTTYMEAKIQLYEANPATA